MNRYAYVFNDPVNATDPSGFISMGDVVGGFVAAGHGVAGLVMLGSTLSGNPAATNFTVVGGTSGGTTAAAWPSLQGRPSSTATPVNVPTMATGQPDLRLAQNMGDPSTGTDIPGNVPDSQARPDVPPRLGPDAAMAPALPRALLAIAEVAEAWLTRAAVALEIMASSSAAQAGALAAPIVIPGDSVVADTSVMRIDPTRPAKDVLPGSLHREFPGQHLDKSLNQIKEALRAAKGKDAESLRKAKKLLEQSERLVQKNK